MVWLERGGRTALTWGSDGDCLAEAAGTLAALVRAGRVDGLTITTMDAAPALEGEHPFAVALLRAECWLSAGGTLALGGRNTGCRRADLTIIEC